MEYNRGPEFTDPEPVSLFDIRLSALNLDKSSDADRSSDIEALRRPRQYNTYVECRRIANSRRTQLIHNITSCYSCNDSFPERQGKAAYRLSHFLIESPRQALREVHDGIE